MSGLLPVADALSAILASAELTPIETVALSQASGRVLAEDLRALRTQPPFDASAMDGYAVRAVDTASAPTALTMIGESAAGHPFSGSIGKGECVRIFTGAPLPEGADTILIQENARADGNTITALQAEPQGRFVRPAGGDFALGDVLLDRNCLLDPGALSLAAAMNHAELPVRSRPKVAILATGDELKQPGSELGPGEIIASNSFGVAAMIAEAGGTALDLGIARDTLADLETALDRASDADIIVTLGGASVGDHDLVRTALMARGADLDFWRLAMRPGKPVMFGRLGTGARVLGLPGNPVSSLVCTTIFLQPLIRAMLGRDPTTPRETALLGTELPENDEREEYMRATSVWNDGTRVVSPVPSQDSSLLSLYHRADCLIVRTAHAKPQNRGSAVEIINI